MIKRLVSQQIDVDAEVGSAVRRAGRLYWVDAVEAGWRCAAIASQNTTIAKYQRLLPLVSKPFVSTTAAVVGAR